MNDNDAYQRLLGTAVEELDKTGSFDDFCAFFRAAAAADGVPAVIVEEVLVDLHAALRSSPRPWRN